MAKFLYGKDLNEAVYDLIEKARKTLLIISPFIKLDNYFKKQLFDNLKGNSNLQIIIAFGKNADSINSSFNKEDFEYFKEFPKISIVYIPNLHAKYYANEQTGIITSINLYDYSFKNNIEFGVKFESNILIPDKVDHEAWKTAKEIIEKNYTVFVRIPTFKKKIIGKDYIGSVTKYDVIDELIRTGKVPKKNIFDFEEEGIINIFGKKGDRLSREEFEKQEELIEEKEKVHIEPPLKRDSNGFCIRCKKFIPLDPLHPYCYECYNQVNSSKSFHNKESFCHVCGDSSGTMKKTPACHSCWKQTRDTLIYPPKNNNY